MPLLGRLGETTGATVVLAGPIAWSLRAAVLSLPDTPRVYANRVAMLSVLASAVTVALGGVYAAAAHVVAGAGDYVPGHVIASIAGIAFFAVTAVATQLAAVNRVLRTIA